MTRVVNLLDVASGEELQHDGFRHHDLPVGPLLGAELLGCSLYDVPPGARNWPYHFHLGNEEWLLVLAGEPTLRDPGGARTLRPGEGVCFPEGPAGPHRAPYGGRGGGGARRGGAGGDPDSDALGAGARPRRARARLLRPRRRPGRRDDPVPRRLVEWAPVPVLVVPDEPQS